MSHRQSHPLKRVFSCLWFFLPILSLLLIISVIILQPAAFVFAVCLFIRKELFQGLLFFAFVLFRPLVRNANFWPIFIMLICKLYFYAQQFRTKRLSRRFSPPATFCSRSYSKVTCFCLFGILFNCVSHFGLHIFHLSS